MQAYTQPLSLWRLVEEHSPIHEQDVLKNMLGNSLVDQSLELHDEIEMLLDIWREMREEEQPESTHSSRTLPEPPNQRDRLVQEICFFVASVKEKAKSKGIDADHLMKRNNTDVLNYAAEQSRPGSSMGRSSHSSDGRETPMMPLSPDRLSLAHDITDEVEAANRHLNYLDFDQVYLNLREALEKEVGQLLRDIQFLQSCLDDAADIRDCVTPRLTSREPTLTELREERSLLEKELLSTDGLAATPNVHKLSFNTTDRVLPATPPSASSGVSSPLLPTKASHNAVKPLRARHDINQLGDRDLAKDAFAVPHAPAVNCPKSDSSIASPSQTNLAIDSNTSVAPILPNCPRVPTNDGHGRRMNSPRGASPSTNLKTVGDINFRLSSPSIRTANEGGTVLSGRPRRRTVSPGRVRVVDVTTIVDSHLSKGDPGSSHRVDGFSSPSSSPNSAFSPSPPTTGPDRDRNRRPESAHADRFRKMVLGCRDGE